MQEPNEHEENEEEENNEEDERQVRRYFQKEQEVNEIFNIMFHLQEGEEDEYEEIPPEDYVNDQRRRNHRSHPDSPRAFVHPEEQAVVRALSKNFHFAGIFNLILCSTG